MPKRVIRGEGMKERGEVQFDMTDPADAAAAMQELHAAFARLPVLQEGEAGCDAWRRENAERMRRIAVASGLPDPSPDGGDHKAAWIAAAMAANAPGAPVAGRLAVDWLRWYRANLTARAEVAAGSVTAETLAQITDTAEYMGRIAEELWWRAGVDPATGRRREELALVGRKAQAASRQGAAARRSGGLQATKGAELQARADAMVADGSRLSWSRVRELIARAEGCHADTLRFLIDPRRKSG